MANSGLAEALEQRVLRFIRGKHLVSAGQKLLVAVSGGADSVCLLHILARLQGELGITLTVAHLDHRLRGAEAEADAAYVARLALRLNIPASIEARDVPAYKAKHRLSLEEAAREVRYEFLDEIARSVGAERLAVGHTADDHLETILMHLLRGSGTRGLRGLPALVKLPSATGGLTIIRPLLEASREETAAYCEHYLLKPRLDTSNLSLVPMRNRLRHSLLPELSGYNPRVKEALLRLAHTAADDMDFIDSVVTQLWEKVARREGDTIILPRKSFTTLPPALKRHLLRASMETLLGNLRDIEARHIEDMMDALDKPAGRQISLPEGLTFAVEYDRYLLGADPAALSPLPALKGETSLNVPGRTKIPGWDVEATITTPGEAGETTDGPDGFTARLDYDKTGGDLAVRPRRPGDRFQPLGMKETKKLNQFMIDEKIPQAWRERVPVVVSPQQIVWVAGYRPDERVKVTDSTRKVLRLRFERV